MNVTADRTRAIVVGIERYQHPDLADISGPALDACRFTNWLMRRGVPASNIDLILSPLESNINTCHEIAGAIDFLDASENVIHEALFERLQSQSSQLLIIFWGGHGIMDDDQSRVLFCSDATQSHTANLHLSDLLNNLTTDNYKGHPNQQIVIDACANFEDISTRLNTLPKRLGGHGQQQPGMRQFRLFSAARGQRARNKGSVGTGAFSEALLLELEDTDGVWPGDLNSVSQRIGKRMQRQLDGVLGSDQTPVSLEYAAPNGPSHFHWIEPADSRRMINRIEAAEKVELRDDKGVQVINEGDIQRFYIRSRIALADAGRVSGADHSENDSAFAHGLYVRRDIEAGLLGAVRDSDATPILVTGRPGTGKTSVLWGLGSSLAMEEETAVLFVRAPWLLKGRSAEDPSLPQAIITGTLRLVAQGKRVVVLIDTADTVVADEFGHAMLIYIIDELSKASVSVVITSRPEEAKLLPPAWRRQLDDDTSTALGDYSREPSGDDGTSEFERAVASHARAYRTKHGHHIDILIHQLVNTVVRRKSMSALCFRPLFLQMLFHLYAPRKIPEDLSVTALYQKYWLERVTEDKRDFIVQQADATARDLTEITSVLALEMLRQGSPELLLSSVALPNHLDAKTFASDVHALVSRGVGEDTGGTFRFFHQTFFEFAAAQALLTAAGTKAVDVLLRRARSHPGDYFLLAVLEQTWLCAWQHAEYRSAASARAEALLREISQSGAMSGPDKSGDTVPFSLQQTIISVVAQVPIASNALVEDFEVVLASGTYDLVRYALRLLPTQGRPVGAIDQAAVVTCARRWGGVRAAAIETFGRIAEGAPDRAVSFLPELALVPEDTGREPTDSEVSVDGKLTDMIVDLAVEDLQSVLDALERVIRHSQQANRQRAAVDVFYRLAQLDDTLAGAVANWCDGFTQTLNFGAETSRSLALVHKNRVICLVKEKGWLTASQLLLDALRRTDCATTISRADLNVISGSLMAINSSTPESVFSMVLDALRQCESNSVHAETHLGYLVPFISFAPQSLRDTIAASLAEGLPTTRTDTSAGASRWSDTLRRSLEMPQVPLDIAADIGERAAGLVKARLGVDMDHIWTTPDFLLTNLIKSAAGGAGSARSALLAAAEGRMPLSPAGRRYISVRARDPEGSPEEIAVVLNLILELGDSQATLQLIDNRPPHSIVLSSNDRTNLRALISGGLARPDEASHGLAARLLRAAVTKGILPIPPLDEIRSHLLRFPYKVADRAAIEIVNFGFDEGAYSSVEAMSVATDYLQAAKSSEVESSEPARVARRLQVKILADTSAANEWQTVLQSVFQVPMDTRAAIIASSFVRDDHRKVAGPDMNTKIAFIVAFGTKMESSSLSVSMAKDIARAWGPTVMAVMAGAQPAHHAVLLEALTRMECRFGQEAARSINLGQRRDLLDRAKKLVDSPQMHPNVRTRLADAIRDASQLTSPSSWLDLDGELVSWSGQ